MGKKTVLASPGPAYLTLLQVRRIGASDLTSFGLNSQSLRLDWTGLLKASKDYSCRSLGV